MRLSAKLVPAIVVGFLMVALLSNMIMVSSIRSTIDDIASDVTVLKNDVTELSAEGSVLRTSIDAVKDDVVDLQLRMAFLQEEVNREQSRFRRILAAIKNSEEASVGLHERIFDDRRRQEAVVVEEEIPESCLFGAMFVGEDGRASFVIPYYNAGQPPPTSVLYFLCDQGPDGQVYRSDLPEEAILANPESLLWLVAEEPPPEPVNTDGTVFN